MAYIIHNNKRPLSYFYGNGNGRIRDILGFSNNNYFIFDTKEKAKDKIKQMKEELINRAIDLKLSIKLYKIFERLKIKEVA